VRLQNPVNSRTNYEYRFYSARKKIYPSESHLHSGDFVEAAIGDGVGSFGVAPEPFAVRVDEYQLRGSGDDRARVFQFGESETLQRRDQFLVLLLGVHSLDLCRN
jgi:hypothetical protein